MGGDSRQVLDPLSNFNRYGCSPQPRLDVMALGSCTASSPRLTAWAAAEKKQRILQDALSGRAEDTVFEEHFELIRHRICTVLELDPAFVDICFSPSATDGEFLALWLAIAGTNEPVCNVVVAPDEVGGGTPLAAKGCHFSDLTPWDTARGMKSEPVAGFPLKQIELETVPVREPEGQLRAIAAIERQIVALVERKIAAGRRVLLHVVEHTKTGVRAPSLGLTRQLKEQYGNSLMVVVDAAQGRIDRRRIAIYLQLGCLVLLSGSKFFGGPPFSGALLVPRTDQFRPTYNWQVPVGLTDYLTAFEIPPHWRPVRQLLPKRKNVGLLLRWVSALAEMEEYYSHPLCVRRLVLQKFYTQVERIFSDSVAIRSIPHPIPHLVPQDYALGDELEFEHGASVFSFTLHTNPASSAAGSLNMTALRHIHFWLHQSLLPMSSHGEFGPASLEILQQKFHLGQPVFLGKSRSTGSEVCVLRVAMGAALLNQLIADTSLGSNLSDRLNWMSQQLTVLRQKLEAVAWLAQRQEHL